MEKIHSKTAPDTVLHIIFRKADFHAQEKRGAEISSADHELQARTIAAKAGDMFPAHWHPEQDRHTRRTQESLVIVQGSVRATYYDTDHAVIASSVLHAGDLTISFAGGHRYEILEDHTYVYEHKNGPYNGFEKDKKLIEGD